MPVYFIIKPLYFQLNVYCSFVTDSIVVGGSENKGTDLLLREILCMFFKNLYKSCLNAQNSQSLFSQFSSFSDF